MAATAWRAAVTFAKNTSSYRVRAAGGTGVGRVSCANLGLGVVVLRVLTLVRDVAVLRIEERSELDPEGVDVDARELREEGGRERGGGGGGPSRLATNNGEWRGEVGADDGGFEGLCGSLGGSGASLDAYTSQSCETEETEGLTADVMERFSKDSSRLMASCSMLARSCSKSSWSPG